AKIDTGARSSALHAFNLDVFERRKVQYVRFVVHPHQRTARDEREVEHELKDWRWIRSSTGHRTLRPVIVTELAWMGERWPIELTLVGRDSMGFRMLLGRSALRGRYVVDPGRSYLGAKHDGHPVRRGRKQS
ncbi:MAG: ATP-dependent zinc protease, partial [Gemmatimonadetes bacterium]|nr:ATP-dependent zinc protease [Gemmatimonadota bacterium]